MPSLAADYDEIVRTLEAAFGEPDRAEEATSGGFRDLLVVFLAEQRGGKGGRAIEGLDRDGLSLDPASLAATDPRELLEALRDGQGPVPGGLVATLVRLASWVAEHGGMEGLSDVATSTIREELRAIRGIGAASADRILLDAMGRPAVPIGRSDYRILLRHGWIDPSSDYDEAREAVESAAKDDLDALRRLSSWFGALAKPCKVTRPQCDRCPLRPLLPEGGPLDPS